MKTTFREENGKYIATLEGRLDTVAADQTESNHPEYQLRNRKGFRDDRI